VESLAHSFGLFPVVCHCITIGSDVILNVHSGLHSLHLSSERVDILVGSSEIDLEISILTINEETAGVSVLSKGDCLCGLTGGDGFAAHSY
jgi:hypothetical protein